MDGFDIASKIVDDICDRKGLKSAWHSIDDSTQEDIIETWSGLIDDELAIANKAIVALSEALEDARRPLALYKAYGWGDGLGVIPKAESALTTHAPAIEKARGG